MALSSAGATVLSQGGKKEDDCKNMKPILGKKGSLKISYEYYFEPSSRKTF